MNDNPMTEQVARLIGNLLAGGSIVCLPGVGSLRVERQPARRIDRRHVVPPCRRVEFSSQQSGVSLVEEIARVLRVNGVKPEDPMPEAGKVYDRWLAQVREGETLTIVGVGTLRFKDFKLDEAFDRRLNPQGHEAVRVRAPRRFDAVLWIGILAIVCVLGATAYWWYGERRQHAEMLVSASDRTAQDAGRTQLPEGVSGTAPGSQPNVTGNSTAGKEPLVEAAATAPADSGTATLPTPESPTTSGGTAAISGTADPKSDRESPAMQSASETRPAVLVSGRSYVVMGVFSSEANARRAAREASSKEVAITCGVYRFGAKYMVSPFESDDPETCRLFIRAHAERFPGMWTYTAR